jgi:uncharacterized protein
LREAIAIRTMYGNTACLTPKLPPESGGVFSASLAAGTPTEMEGLENTSVTAVDQLATLYAQTVRAPPERDRPRRYGGTYLHRRLAISNPSDRRQPGARLSPKGDKPGFVQVEDDGRTLLISDRRGNNRIDSIKNVVEDPRVALIFLVPGANETYRVNGRPRVSVDLA